HKCEGDACAAAGVFDDRHPGFQGAALLGALDHRERHAILVRPGGTVVLELHSQVRRALRDDPRQADQRGVPDRGEHTGYGLRYPFATSSSALRTAAPAAPRIVL